MLASLSTPWAERFDDMVRDKILAWLSRTMYVVAALVAASLVLEYGFHLNQEQEQLLHLVDIVVLAIFALDALIRFGLSRRKLSYVRARWPALAIVCFVVSQIFLVSRLAETGWLPAFLEARSVFALSKGYIIILQIYLVFLIVAEAVRANRRLASLRIRPGATVILSFVFIILVGTLLLLTPRATVGGEISLVDALFSATSSVCVTGLIVVDTGSYFSGFGQGIVLTLIQIGGLGLITFTAFFALVMRRGLGVREGLVLRGMMTFEAIGQIGRTLRYMIGLTLLLEGAGAALLFLATRFDFATVGEAASRSVFHSVSAFCNAGFSLYSTSFERYAGNVPVNLVMTSLIVIGGLGFPVVMNFFGRRVLSTGSTGGGPRWSLHSRLVLAMTAALLIAGTLSFLLLENSGALAGKPFGEKLLVSYFQSVTARTAGFNTVRTASLALPTLFMLAALMFIGGSPGGTAGGVKTVSFGLVLASIRSMFGGGRRVELFRRRVPDRIVSEALVVVAVGIIVVAGGTFVLLMLEDLTLSQVLFEVVSAFGTVGLSTGVTPTLSSAGKIVLMIIMLTGRIGPLTLALAIGQRRERMLYDYAEERVVIG
jgi:trk system potassium uptake protein TrkH